MNDFLAIIPLYNKENLIHRSVRSALNQNYPCDVLVLDDGSTDNSLERVQSLENKNLKILSHANQGVSYTRNLGINYAVKKGYHYVAFLDADDYWLPNHIEIHNNLASKFPEASVYGSNYNLLSKGKLSETKFSNMNAQRDLLLECFFEHNYLNSVLSGSSFSLRVSEFNNTIMFDESLTHAEDTDFFFKLGIYKKIAFSKTVTAVIDKSAENRSDKVKKSKRSYPDFSKYQSYISKHSGLSKYLDLNRFALTIFYRINEDLKKSHEIRQSINLDNLSAKQRLLLKMSRNQLKTLKSVQNLFLRMGIRLRTGD